jgi:hypothetical protein
VRDYLPQMLVVFFVAACAAALFGRIPGRVEAAGAAVKQWQATEVFGSRVEVVDVGPVCLYVVNGVSPSIWGISKAQLPAGKGCQ